MKVIDNISDLESFVQKNENTKVLITPQLNEILGKQWFPANSRVTSEEIDMSFKTHNIMNLMRKKSITVEDNFYENVNYKQVLIAKRGKKMKVYIAGKITGDEEHREKFAIAQRKIEQSGNIALNPAVLPEGMTARDYMLICFAMIDIADLVWFLDDYAESKGAMVEHEYCQYVGKQTAYGNSLYWRCVGSSGGKWSDVIDIDPVYAAGGCYCRECEFYTDNMHDSTLRNGFCTQLKHYNFNKKEPTDFCSYGESQTEGK